MTPVNVSVYDFRVFVTLTFEAVNCGSAANFIKGYEISTVIVGRSKNIDFFKTKKVDPLE